MGDGFPQPPVVLMVVRVQARGAKGQAILGQKDALSFAIDEGDPAEAVEQDDTPGEAVDQVRGPPWQGYGLGHPLP